MPQALIIKRISRRTGVKGLPRSTSQQDGVRRIEPGENLNIVKRQVLAEVKAKTKRDGHDRQIEHHVITVMKNGRRTFRTRVLWRVYRSHSDNKVHTYAGEAHQGARE